MKTHSKKNNIPNENIVYANIGLLTLPWTPNTLPNGVGAEVTPSPICYSRSSLEKRQKRLVQTVMLCALIVIVTTITWGLARFPREPDTVRDLPPSDSKEGHYTRAAVSADSTVCPPIGRYEEPFHSDSQTATVPALFRQEEIYLIWGVNCFG